MRSSASARGRRLRLWATAKLGAVREHQHRRDACLPYSMALRRSGAAQTGEGGLLVQTRGKLLSLRFFFSILMVSPQFLGLGSM